MTSSGLRKITASDSKCQDISVRVKRGSLIERERGREMRDGGYLGMQGRTDESLGSGCCCCKLKHLPVNEGRVTWSGEDRLMQKHCDA